MTGTHRKWLSCIHPRASFEAGLVAEMFRLIADGKRALRCDNDFLGPECWSAVTVEPLQRPDGRISMYVLETIPPSFVLASWAAGWVLVIDSDGNVTATWHTAIPPPPSMEGPHL